MPPPARSHEAPDRLAREPVGAALLRAVLRPAQVAVALEPRREVAHAGVGLALAVGRVRRGPPPGRLDRPPAVGRHHEVDALLVQPLPELPPGRRAAVAEVEVDGGGDAEQLRRAHSRKCRSPALRRRTASRSGPPSRSAVAALPLPRPPAYTRLANWGVGDMVGGSRSRMRAGGVNKLRAVLVGLAATGLVLLPAATASHTPNPTAVTIAGSLQSEAGCPGDWDPGLRGDPPRPTTPATTSGRGRSRCPPGATSTRPR